MTTINALTAKLNQNDGLTVGVVGVGYIGSVLACVMADNGINVVGVDTNKARIAALNGPDVGISEPGLQDLFTNNKARLTFSDDYAALNTCDVVLVTVGTPLDDNLTADTSAIFAAAKAIAPHLQDGALVCVKSTVTPNITAQFGAEIAAATGKQPGADFFLAFSPERLAEGRAVVECQTFPVVVGSDNADSAQLAGLFWQNALKVETIILSSYNAAELTKLADNLWIDVNIALANAIALVCNKYGVRSEEVIKAANTLPKGEHHVNILASSIGVGGSCLTKDPIFFANLMDEANVRSDFIREARAMNDSMPQRYCQIVRDHVAANKLDNVKVALIGLAFKSDTDDLRYTPMTEVYTELAKDFKVMLNDPIVAEAEFSHVLGEQVGYTPLGTCLGEADVIIFGCAHQQITVDEIAGHLADNKKNYLAIDGRKGYQGLRDICPADSYLTI